MEELIFTGATLWGWTWATFLWTTAFWLIAVAIIVTIRAAIKQRSQTER